MQTHQPPLQFQHFLHATGFCDAIAQSSPSPLFFSLQTPLPVFLSQLRFLHLVSYPCLFLPRTANGTKGFQTLTQERISGGLLPVATGRESCWQVGRCRDIVQGFLFPSLISRRATQAQEIRFHVEAASCVGRAHTQYDTSYKLGMAVPERCSIFQGWKNPRKPCCVLTRVSLQL